MAWPRFSAFAFFQYAGALICALGLGLGASAAEPGPKHGLAIYGELKYPPDFTHYEYVSPDAPKGGQVRLAAIGTFDTLNPFILKGVPAAGIKACFESLLEKSFDEPVSSYGLLAETVAVSDDGLEVRFRLRPEARFHDGSPVRPEDVVFSFEILREKGLPFYRSYYRDVEKVTAEDERTVRFVLKTAENRELPAILGEMSVLSKTYYETHPFEETTLEPPLCSGPYQVDKVDQGRSITYRRNPDYWGRDLPINRGRHNVDVIRYDYYRDATIAVEALKSGEYDLRQENISRNWATAYDGPALRDHMLVKEQVPHGLPAGMQGFLFNLRLAKFQDVRVREAIGLAFDFEWINKSIFYDAYRRTVSYYDNSPFATAGLPDEKELALLEPFRDQLPPALFTEPFTLPTTDGSGNNRANLRRASKLLEKAGWVVKEGKRVNTESGEPLTIDFLLSSASFERVISPFQRHLEKLGIVSTIRVVDSAQYQKRLENFDFDMIVHIFPQSLHPGNEQSDYWHSETANLEGSRNLMGITDPVVDALIGEVTHYEDYAALKAAVGALDRVLLWRHYMVPNWTSGTFRIAYWDRFGKPTMQPLYDLGFPDIWWVDEEKNAAVDAYLNRE